MYDGSYFVSDIQDYGEKTSNPLIIMYINKVENSIKFKIKTRYYLELWTPKTMKLLGGAKVWLI